MRVIVLTIVIWFLLVIIWIIRTHGKGTSGFPRILLVPHHEFLYDNHHTTFFLKEHLQKYHKSLYKNQSIHLLLNTYREIL